MENSKNLFKQSIQKIIIISVCAMAMVWGSFWYLSGSPLGLFRFGFVYYTTTKLYMNEVPKHKIFEGMLDGMVRSLGDPHSWYLTPEAFKNLKEQTTGKYSGIGVVIAVPKDRPEVMGIIEGQPAQEAGLKLGDIILKIGNKDTINLKVEDVSNMLRGKAGTTVKLEVLRANKRLPINIERKTIDLPVVKGEMLNDDIGYIKIVQFTENVNSEFIESYKKLQKEGMKKMVLDLRNNPGGLVTGATFVSNYLIPEGPVVSIKNRYGSNEIYKSLGEGTKMPLVVLVNSGSASASEIVAAAVQDTKSGIILGEKTYGKGTVQSVIPGLEGEAVKITIAKYHTPKDRVIDKKGVTPDIIVPLKEQNGVVVEDNQLQEAIKILQKEK